MTAQYQLMSKSGVARLAAVPFDTLEELTNIYTPAMAEPMV